MTSLSLFYLVPWGRWTRRVHITKPVVRIRSRSSCVYTMALDKFAPNIEEVYWDKLLRDWKGRQERKQLIDVIVFSETSDVVLPPSPSQTYLD